MTPEIRVVGVGRACCGDDAIGILVARQLVSRLGDLATVVTETGSGTALLEAMEEARLVVVTDAAEADHNLAPGAWRRIDLTDSADCLSRCRLRDTHTVSVESLLRLARALGRTPAGIWLYALAGSRFAPETPPSPAVAEALPRLIGQIAADLHAWVSAGPPLRVVEAPRTGGS